MPSAENDRGKWWIGNADTDPLHSAENDALTEAERRALHAPHAVPINPEWQGCPLCPDYVQAVERILAARVIPPDEGHSSAGSGHDHMTAAENDAPHCPTCTCGCTCGYGGLHEPENPMCELNQRVIPPE